MGVCDFVDPQDSGEVEAMELAVEGLRNENRLVCIEALRLSRPLERVGASFRPSDGDWRVEKRWETRCWTVFSTALGAEGEPVASRELPEATSEGAPKGSTIRTVLVGHGVDSARVSKAGNVDRRASTARPA